MHRSTVVKTLFFLLPVLVSGQGIGLLKYNGGGDWYANPTSLENLSTFYNETFSSETYVIEKPITPDDLLESGASFVHATGHGRMYFTDQEILQLRLYVTRGGFLHFDDNYGMAEFAKTELAKVFPESPAQPVPLDHALFKTPFRFDQGLPKIHEHDQKPPQALGYFLNGNLVALLTLESDLGDGWEDPEVHNDSKENREKALRMGANLVHWSMTRNTSNDE
jgi:hypothetical protein